jgi:hypothetical protein
MITIRKETKKQEILDSLSKELKGEEGVEIVVESLPLYLNSKVSFLVFCYQIQNYPKPITWISSNSRLIEWFKEVGLSYKKPPAEESSLSAAGQNPLVVVSSVSSSPKQVFPPQGSRNSEVVVQADNSNNIDNQVAKLESLDLKADPESADFLTNSLNFRNKNQVIEENVSETGDVENSKNEFFHTFKREFLGNGKKNESNADPKNPTPHNESVLDILSFDEPDNSSDSNSDKDYKLIKHPHKVSDEKTVSTKKSDKKDLMIDRVNYPEHGENQSSGSKDDWDELLKKIEDTKKSLDRLQTTTNAKPKRFNLLKLTSLGVAGLTVFAVFFSFFAFLAEPTTVYTLEFESRTQSAEEKLTLDIQDFSKRKQTYNTFSEAETTGFSENRPASFEAVGEIVLINTASKSINLSNGRFKILNRDTGKYYEHIYDSKLPQTINVPANSALESGIRTNVKAERGGDDYQLPSGTQFRVQNLRNQTVASRLYAQSVSEITVPSIEVKQFVASEDRQKLLNTNSELLLADYNKEIGQISSQKNLIDRNWINENEIVDNFSHKEGDQTTKISLESKRVVEYFFLPYNAIEQNLKKRDIHIEALEEVSLLGYDQSFPQNPENTVEIQIKYTYYPVMSLDEKEIGNSLSGREFNEAKQEIINKHPGIVNIDKKNSGIPLPGVKPQVDVEIIEKDSNDGASGE